MQNIKLIAIDMDGTLLNDDGNVSPYTKKVIKRAQDEGIHIVLSTGRPLEMCISYAHDLQLSSYMITSNGAQIFTSEEQLLESHPIAAEKVEKLWRLGHERELLMWMVAADAIFVAGERPSNFSDYQWFKIGYGNLEKAEQLYLLEKIHHFDSVEITNSSPNNLEINEGGVNKALAVRSVCNRIGITPDQVLALGDSLNDYKMMKEAGIGVAVANAQTEIKEIADYVTKTNNEDGVAKAIERFALNS